MVIEGQPAMRIIVLAALLVVGPLVLAGVGALMFETWPDLPRIVRRALGALGFGGYFWIGVRVFAALGHGYARDGASYDPGGGCKFMEDSSGCRPYDLRPGWLIVWGGLGLVVVLIWVARHRRGA